MLSVHRDGLPCSTFFLAWELLERTFSCSASSSCAADHQRGVHCCLQGPGLTALEDVVKAATARQDAAALGPLDPNVLGTACTNLIDQTAVLGDIRAALTTGRRG